MRGHIGANPGILMRSPHFRFFCQYGRPSAQKVTAAKLDANGAADSTLIRDRAQRYFAFALRVLKPVSPMLVAVGGLSGTGKSVLARVIAPHLDPAPGAVILRFDVERKMMFGVAEADRLQDSAYAPDVGKLVYTALAENAGKVVAAGHSVVVDAVLADATERSQIASVAAGGKIHFCGLFLTADVDTRLSRLAGRRGNASDADQNNICFDNSTHDKLTTSPTAAVGKVRR